MLASISDTRAPELTDTVYDDLSATKMAFMNRKFK
jgi:hypothetical protein